MCVILRDHADDGDHNDEWAWYLLWRRLCSWIFSFSAGSDSGEQQLIVNSFLWNPFLSGIFTWKITPLQSHQHCQKEQDHLSYYNIFVRCRELHNDDSVWVSRVEDHMSCRRCLWPLPGRASPTASCFVNTSTTSLFTIGWSKYCSWTGSSASTLPAGQAMPALLIVLSLRWISTTIKVMKTTTKNNPYHNYHEDGYDQLLRLSRLPFNR